MAYGAGAKKIASFLKKPVELVEQWIEADEKRYPGVKRWQEEVHEQNVANRLPTNRFMTHPDTGVRVQLGQATYQTPEGTRYTFQEVVTPEWQAKRGVLSGFMPTEEKNYPVQGTGGTVMKVAMYLTVRSLYRYKNFDGRVLAVNTVHDAAYLDAHPDFAMKAGVLLHACMLEASNYYADYLSVDIPLPVPADTHFGPNMASEKEFDFPEGAVDKFRAAMRGWYGYEARFN